VTTLGAAATEIRDELAAAGLRVTLEPDEINPPCVWIQLKHLEDRHLAAGVVTAEWYVYLVAPKAGSENAYNALHVMRNAVLGLGWSFVGISEGVELTIPGGGNPLPALRMTLRTQIT
jgi:hypothetical protein